MAGLLFVSEAEVRRLLDLEELADQLRQALLALSEGTSSTPHRVGAESGGGMLGVMPGYAPALGLGVKLVSVFPGNSGPLPSHQALVCLFDESNGAPLAVMGGTYLTAIRTAMTSAVAARALCVESARSLAIIGAGAQGAAHLEAFTHLFSPTSVRVWSRDDSKARALASAHAAAEAVATPKEAVAGADLVCCCTDAREPVLDDRWVTPGSHVSSVGSYCELPELLLGRARIFVESRDVATAPRPAGVLQLAGWDAAALTEVGEVLGGKRAGRTTSEEVTIFESTGNAVEDLAAASVVLRRARATSSGLTVDLAG